LNALSFLQSVSGFTQAQNSTSSADKPVLIGTIDGSYSPASFPGTLPQVTFDGEDTLSGKRYAVMSGYRPAPADRVVLIPVGTTYLIIGALDEPEPAVLDTTWQTYTPTLTATPTPPTKGNSVYTGRYAYLTAKTIAVEANFVMGTTFSAGNGVYIMSVPVAPSAGAVAHSVGSMYLFDNGVANRTGIVSFADTTGVYGFINGASTPVAHSTQTWGSADFIRMSIVYEVA
jgi:hypothetical protein